MSKTATLRRPKTSSATWKHSIVFMTPLHASILLKKNSKNRPISNQRIDQYTSDMMCGNWKLLPGEGIAIGDDGDIVNGQHRLLAVIKADMPVEMNLFENVPRSLYPFFDKGYNRSTAVSTGIPKRLVEEANLALYFIGFKNSTDLKVSTMANRLELFSAVLKDHCGTTVKYWSQTPARLGAIARMMEGGNDAYVLDAYRSLVLHDVASMPPSILKHYISKNKSGKLNTGGQAVQMENTCLFYSIFDASKKNNKIIRAPGENRDVVKQLMLDCLSDDDKKVIFS